MKIFVVSIVLLFMGAFRINAGDFATIVGLIGKFEDAISRNDKKDLADLVDFESPEVKAKFMEFFESPQHQWESNTPKAGEAPLVVRHPANFGAGKYLMLLPSALGHVPKTYEVSQTGTQLRIRIRQCDLPVLKSDLSATSAAKERVESEIKQWSNAKGHSLSGKVIEFRQSLHDSLAYSEYAEKEHLKLFGHYPTVEELRTSIKQTKGMTDAEVRILVIQQLNRALTEL